MQLSSLTQSHIIFYNVIVIGKDNAIDNDICSIN